MNLSDVKTKISRLSPEVDPEIRHQLNKIIESSFITDYPEAVLDVMTRICLRYFDLLFEYGSQKKRPSDNLFDCVEEATKGKLLVPEIATSFHFIRVFSNRPHHDSESLKYQADDVLNALSIFLRSLEWLYCEFHLGPKLQSIYTIDFEEEIKIIEDITRKYINRMVSIGHYKPDLSIDRIVINKYLETFLKSDKNLLLIDGPIGAGKTTFLCGLSRERLKEGKFTLLGSFELIMEKEYNIFFEFKKETIDFFRQISSKSRDKILLIILDNFLATTDGEKFLKSCINWLLDYKNLLENSVKFILAMRIEHKRIIEQLINELSWANIIDQFTVPSLTDYEIYLMLQKFKKNYNFRALSSIHQSLKRPLFIVSLLNLNSVQSSIFYLYDELLKKYFFGFSVSPLRFQIVKRIAYYMLKYGLSGVSFVHFQDSIDSISLFIDKTSGRKTTDYEFLLSNGILAEYQEDYEHFVTFGDPYVFSLISAKVIKSEIDMLEELINNPNKVQHKVNILAFYFVLLIKEDKYDDILRILKKLPNELCKSVLTELALVESSTFVKLYEKLHIFSDDFLFSILQSLYNLGEFRTIIDVCNLSNAVYNNDKFKMLKIQTLYELDEYENALKEITSTSLDDPNILYLYLDILISKGEFQKVVEICFQKIKTSPNYEQEIKIMSALSYALMKLGKINEAENYFMELINLIEKLGEKVDPKFHAEVLGDFAELFIEKGDFINAEKYIEMDREITEKTGFLPGIGVTEGLYGKLYLKWKKYEISEQKLLKCLEISKQVGNLWRATWACKLLSELYYEIGDIEKAKLFSQISSKDDIICL